jgi:hypothetical protein
MGVTGLALWAAGAGHPLLAWRRTARELRRDVGVEADGSGSVSARGEASDPSATVEPTIFVTQIGPHRIVGDVAIFDTEGTLLRRSGTWCPCRCG